MLQAGAKKSDQLCQFLDRWLSVRIAPVGGAAQVTCDLGGEGYVLEAPSKVPPVSSRNLASRLAPWRMLSG